MSDSYSLVTEERTVLGKQVRALRRAGIVPVVVYGPGYPTEHFQVNHRDLRAILLKAGGTHIINLDLNGRSIPTLAKRVSRDPLRGDILHVDFYHVDLERKIHTEIPVLGVNEAPAIRNNGVVSHPITRVEVEALPGNLPEHIEVDLSVLLAVGDHITLADLKMPEGVRLLAHDLSEAVFRVDAMREASEEGEGEASLLGGSTEVEVITRKREEEE